MRDFLKTVADMHRRNNTATKFSCPEDVVLAHGREFVGWQEGIPQMEKKNCFGNAVEYAMRNGLYYCEGFALAAGFFPTLHAWTCDENGVIFDPTWQDPVRPVDHYLGLVFETDFVISTIQRTGYYGLFCPNEWYDKDILNGQFDLVDLPEWVAETA
jgi:hypothetical protein